MSKKNNNNVETSAVAPVTTTAVSTMTFEEALALVPAKEHRNFSESEFAMAVSRPTPADKDGVKAAIAGLSHGGVFAFCVVQGKDGCAKIANICLEGEGELKPSAIASFKSVVKGMTALFAGKTAYGLLSAFRAS